MWAQPFFDFEVKSRVRLFKRFSLALVVFFASTSSLTATAAEIYNPSKLVTAPDQFIFTVGYSNPFMHSTLSLQPPAVEEIGVRGDWLYCYSTEDPTCDFANAKWGPDSRGILGMSVLPYCESNGAENCIENFEISYDGESFSGAKHLRMLESGLTQVADPKLNYLGGASASLWDDSTVKNSKNQSYLTNVVYSVFYSPDTKKFQVSNIAFGVIPYREEVGNYTAPKINKDAPPNSRMDWGGTRDTTWSENGKAGFAMEFPKDARYRLTVRLTNEVTGWYKARLKDPQVGISKFSNTNNRVIVEGQPVSVPTFAYSKLKGNFTPRENKWWQNNGQVNNTTPAGADQSDIFEYLDYFRPLVSDKAAGFNTLWTVNSTNWGNENKCLQDSSRVVGIVSTNAMGFNGNSPSYKDGTLNYQVAGMHYMPDGKSLVEGTYDLLIRSDAARCLYGFSNAPIQASISVTGEADQKVATTAMTEGNGWIKLSAYGFTFSDPTISVKLSQAKVQANTLVKKNKTITCIKGKISKKVSGISPKCPAGYKKR